MVTKAGFVATELSDAANNQKTVEAGDLPSSAEFCLDLEFDRGY